MCLKEMLFGRNKTWVMALHCDRIICGAPWSHSPISRGRPFTVAVPTTEQMNRAKIYVPQNSTAISRRTCNNS